MFRKTEAGINPAIEVGRFLTEVAGFANTPALLGTCRVRRRASSAARSPPSMRWSPNQGDGWTVTSAYLDRFVDDQRLLAADQHAGESEEQIPYLRIMAQAGRRTAELHLALAGQLRAHRFRAGGDHARRCAALDRRGAASAPTALFDALSQRDAVREADRPLVERLLAQRDASCTTG